MIYYFLRMLLNPILQFFVTPFRILQTLWRTLKIVSEKQIPLHYTSFGTMLSCFYLIYNQLIEQSKTSSTELLFHDRQFNMNNIFQHNRIQMWLFARMKIFVYPVCYLLWCCFCVFLLMHLGVSGWALVFLCWGACGSSLVYSYFFFGSNYNVLGFIWLVPFVYCLITGQYSMAAVFGLLLAVFSLTAAVMSLSLVPLVFFSVSGWEWLTAWMAIVGYFLFALSRVDLVHIKSVLAIVMPTSKVKSKYEVKREKFTIWNSYFISMNLLFAILFCWADTQLDQLAFGPFLLLLVNRIARFTDNENLWFFCLSMIFVLTLQKPDPTLIVIFMLLAFSPPALFGARAFIDDIFDTLPALTPDNGALQSGIEKLCLPIPEGQKVLAAFPDPGGKYEVAFFGNRNLIDAIHYHLIPRNIQLLPTLWSENLSANRSDIQYFYKDIDDIQKLLLQFDCQWLLIASDQENTIAERFPSFQKRSWLDIHNMDMPHCCMYKARLSNLNLYEVMQ